MLKAVVLKENTAATANEDEIKLYASSLGIDLYKEPYLLPIAKEGISAALPKGWQILQDENNQIFYYNSVSGQSLWEHPLDELYRQRVQNARASKQNTLVPMKMIPLTTEPSSSGRSSCSTPTAQGHPLSDRHELPDKNTGISAEVRPASPRFESIQKSSTQPEDKPVHSEWLNAPLLGDKIATPQRTELTVPTVSASESEVGTDYCELVPSNVSSSRKAASVSSHRRHTVLLGSTTLGLHARTTTQSTSCQTDNKSDVEDHEAAQDWTLQHCASLDEADRRLTWLQKKLRQSLLADNETFLASPLTLKHLKHPTWLSRSTKSLVNSPRHKSATIATTTAPKVNVNASQVVGCVDNGLIHSSAHLSTDQPSNQGLYPVLASPPCLETHIRDELTTCPEVGVSPSDSKAEKSSSQSPRRASGKQCENRCSRNTTGVLLEHGQLERYRLTESAPSPFVTGGMQGVTMGISHLAEERARLQRKILRLKVIYKTYKQRLASLDSTILLLQQSSATTGSGDAATNTSKFLERSTNRSEPDIPAHQTYLLSDSCPPHKALLQTHNVCSVSSESATSTCRGDYPGPEIIDVHERSEPTQSIRKPRRSVSAPRQPVAAVHYHSVGRSARSHGMQRSVSQELAASLASIDAQLHHVLYHLEPTDMANGHYFDDDEELAKQVDSAKTATQNVRHSGYYSCSPSAQWLQRGLANLSLSDHYSRTSGLGDLRLLTPVSPDCGRDKRFQKPQVDTSPTWLQSD